MQFRKKATYILAHLYISAHSSDKPRVTRTAAAAAVCAYNLDSLALSPLTQWNSVTCARRVVLYFSNFSRSRSRAIRWLCCTRARFGHRSSVPSYRVVVESRDIWSVWSHVLIIQASFFGSVIGNFVGYILNAVISILGENFAIIRRT